MIKNSIQICLRFINTIIMYYNFNRNGLHCYILVLSQYILIKNFVGVYIPTKYREFTCTLVYIVRTMIIRKITV